MTSTENRSRTETKFHSENPNLMDFTETLMANCTSTVRALTGALTMLLFAFGLNQANAQTPAPPQEEPIALTGATIHTISDGTIENGTVLFEDGVISEVGTNVELPEGTREVDYSGKHIYPGLIDSYTNLGIYEIGAVDVTVDIQEYGRINPNARAQVAFNPESRHIGVARSNGVLSTVTTPGGGLISGQPAAMMMEGWSWEEMNLKPSTGLLVNWPSADDEDEYEEELKELRDAFEDARAFHQSHSAMDAGEADRHDQNAKWEAMRPVFEGDLPVIVNANELRQIQDAITWAENQEVDLIILGGRDAHYVSDHLVRKEIPVLVTNVLSSPSRAWESYDGRYALPAKLHEAGVEFAIAGEFSAAYTNRLPYHAGAAVAFGLPEEEAIRAVTQSPAEILGFSDRVGTLESGKDATLMVTDGNPLEYETQIEQAFINGREIDMKGAHEQFYEKYREKVRHYEMQSD